MRTIFEKSQLPHLVMKNRLIRSATWENLANKDGTLPEELMMIYEELAKGGVGAIITSSAEVSSESRTFFGNMLLNKDEMITIYQELTERVHKYHCPILVQLLISDFMRCDGFGKVRVAEIDEITEEEIQHTILSFSKAAIRAKRAGFDGIQIHAAHGFFPCRFISPFYNHRSDRYGGSLEKRTRLLVEILDAVRLAIPNSHISIKINFHDFLPGGSHQKKH